MSFFKRKKNEVNSETVVENEEKIAEKRSEERKAKLLERKEELQEKADKEFMELEEKLDDPIIVNVEVNHHGSWMTIENYEIKPYNEIYIAGIKGISSKLSFWSEPINDRGGFLESMIWEYVEHDYGSRIDIEMTSGRNYKLYCHPQLTEIMIEKITEVWKEHR